MTAPNVPLHPLGRNGPLVPAMGQGLLGASMAYGQPLGEEEIFEVLDKAMYGDSEKMIGKWFKKTGKRSDIFLASKFGAKPDYSVDSSPEYAKEACERSLRDFGVEYIDLYYMHMPDPKTPIEETMRGLVELQSQGKIKHIGLSMVSAKALRRAVKIAPVAALQVDYALLTRNIEATSDIPEANILATCRELGVALVAATPLGRGVLTNRYTDVNSFDDAFRGGFPRFQPESREHNGEFTRAIQSFAEKKGCTITQLALAWLLKQGNDIFPIPGTRNAKYVEENFLALKVQLSDEEEAEIRRYVESVEVVGDFVPAYYKATVYLDTPEETV
ncbi:aldo/keto reductase family protein [Sarocladium implicatum]|nr:aldo/keto reductase family protein [Sarocladium implicatum]